MNATASLRFGKVLLLAACLLPPGLHAQAMIEGNAVLTSRNGTIRIADQAGQIRSVEPRTGFNPNGVQWGNENNARAFLALSNGSAIGIGGSTRLRFIDYQQVSFGADKTSFSYEPSTSRLTLELETGEIALACQRLSPISDIRVGLPYGSLRIHRGIAHIRYGSTGLHLAMIEGNLTYYYPGSDAREFVAAGSIIRISDQSARRQQVAERMSMDTLSAEAVELYQAATHASRRVHFQANAETGAPPEPLMVVSPDYYEQASPRPYEFKE